MSAPDKNKSKSEKYGCQEYSIARMCRFDRRAADVRCNGCQRITDREYLERQGLWIEGVSHKEAA